MKIQNLTKFQKRVLGLVRQIPKGKVTTYKMIAKVLRRPKAQRAVGNALNKNPKPIKIPCHRVVRSNGQIGSYKLGQRKKIKLLEREEIIIKNKRVQELDKYLFRW